MKTIEINEMSKIIETAPVQMNLMFIGGTGIGKTTVIEQYCKDNGIFLKTLILSQLEASETLGIPVRHDREYNGKIYPALETAIPAWIFEMADVLKKIEESEEGYDAKRAPILFLDEFLCAQPSVMNAFLNFLTQKRVGNIDLSKVRIIAATNIGNYTFDPDNNILSRFCFFYAVNETMNDYINDNRIVNNYKDDFEPHGVIFEQRSLKPRCQELLKYIPDEYLDDFYQGFTNKRYVLIHSDPEINDVIWPYAQMKEFGQYTISDADIVTMVSVMTERFKRFRKWDFVLSGFINLDFDVIEKITEELNRKLKTIEESGSN